MQLSTNVVGLLMVPLYLLGVLVTAVVLEPPTTTEEAWTLGCAIAVLLLAVGGVACL